VRFTSSVCKRELIVREVERLEERTVVCHTPTLVTIGINVSTVSKGAEVERVKRVRHHLAEDDNPVRDEAREHLEAAR